MIDAGIVSSHAFEEGSMRVSIDRDSLDSGTSSVSNRLV